MACQGQQPRLLGDSEGWTEILASTKGGIISHSVFIYTQIHSCALSTYTPKDANTHMLKHKHINCHRFSVVKKRGN